MELSPSRSAIWAIAGIAIIGGALRFCCISAKGIFFWDEGMHLQEAQYLCSIAAGLKRHVGAGVVPLKIKEKITGRDISHLEDGLNSIRGELRGRYPETAKPTHIALIAASMAIFGDRDYSGNVMSALFGTLTIIVVYLIGRRLGGAVVGALGAFLLAFSPLCLIYSRETLAEADGAFFFYCAFLLWLRSKDGPARKTGCLVFAGICAGLSLTCNDRWIIIPPIFLLLEIAARGAKAIRDAGNVFIDYGLWMMGFCAPLVVWELIYYFLKNSLHLMPLDYFDQLWGRTVFHAQFSFGYEGFRAVLMTMARFEGMAAALLLTCSIVMLCVRRRREGAYLLIVLCFPFALYAFRPHHFLRITSLAIPCVYLVIADALGWLESAAAGSRRRGMVRGVVAALAILIVAPNLLRDIKIVRWRSRYREAIEYLRNSTSARHYATNKELSAYYLGGAFVRRPPLRADVSGDATSLTEFPYLIVDKQSHFQTSFGPSESGWVDDVEKKCRPVFEVREDLDGLFFDHFAFEHSVDYYATAKFLEGIDASEAAMIRVYRLNDCFDRRRE